MEQHAFYFNDQWTLEDDFGLAALGDQLARVLLEAPPPFAARVSGKWGSGKTSVMRRAFAVLGGTPLATAVPLAEEKKEKASEHLNLKYDLRLHSTSVSRAKGIPLLDWTEPLPTIARCSLCIWYSPWQHQNEANPLLPLLLEIKAHFSTTLKLKENVKKLNRQGALAALSLVDGLAQLVGVSPNLAGTVEKMTKQWHEGDNPMMKASNGQRFHLAFEDAVAMILDQVAGANGSKPPNPNPGRLIIFIDDLDRCEEATAVKLLECIKLYLNTSNCVFVFGMDNAALLQILARHWPHRTESANREYLEKLFQVTLAVPAPDPDLVSAGIFKQLTAHRLEKEQARGVARYMVELLEPNPRKLKNFTNSYCAQLGLTLPHMVNPDKELYQLLVCLYLREFHGSIWRLIEREPWAFQVLFLVINRIMNVDAPAIAEDAVRRQTLGLMRLLINKHFAHIFEAPEPDASRIHNMSEDDAITHLLDHLDQRRSDTALRDMLNIKDLFTAEYLPQDYILRCLKPKDNS